VKLASKIDVDLKPLFDDIQSAVKDGANKKFPKLESLSNSKTVEIFAEALQKLLDVAHKYIDEIDESTKQLQKALDQYEHDPSNEDCIDELLRVLNESDQETTSTTGEVVQSKVCRETCGIVLPYLHVILFYVCLIMQADGHCSICLLSCRKDQLVRLPTA